MKVYQTDRAGVFVAALDADESPLEPGVFLIPGGAVTVAPPLVAEGQRARWINSDWLVEAVPPPPEPDDPQDGSPGAISDRQFAQGLAEAGLISEDEAEEWVAAGTLPAPLVALVDLLPAEQRFAARMLLRGATRFEFAHPLAEAFALLADPPWSAEDRAAFWRHCATL